MLINNVLFKKIKSNNNLFYNIIGSIGVKGLALVITLISFPIYISYFGDKKILGVWFAILSILHWILTFDLGIGNGLRNYVVEALVEKNDIKVKKYISSAYISIGSISLLIGIIGFSIIGQFNWNLILNIEANLLSNSVLIWVVRIVLSGVLLQLFLKLILSILYALQKTALSNFVRLISNIIILIFISSYRNNDIVFSLKLLAFIYILAINVPLFIASLFVFAKLLKNSRPNFKHFRIDYSKKVMKLGSMFLLIQFSLLLINSTNEILVIRIFGPEEVVYYQAYYRIFSIFLVFFAILTIPIWSAVTKAFNEKRIGWIKKIYRYLNLTSVVVSIVALSLVFVFQLVVNLWLGDNSFPVDKFYVSIFSVYVSLIVFINAATCIANGISKLKPQLYCYIVAALIKIPLTIVLAKSMDSWISIMIVNIIIMIPCLVVQPYYIRKELVKIVE
ncbi:hypothetical protein ACFLSE_05670 [Bacteroidota bacterium]